MGIENLGKQVIFGICIPSGKITSVAVQGPMLRLYSVPGMRANAYFHYEDGRFVGMDVTCVDTKDLDNLREVVIDKLDRMIAAAKQLVKQENETKG